MKLETWDEDDMRGLVKELYEKKGYQVKEIHGRLEPGFDLLATKFDSAGKKVIEELGIQVTIPKADKSRIKDAAMALTREDFHLAYFLIVAIEGFTEDFDMHWRQSELKDRIIFTRGDILEKELLDHGIFPERELEGLESEFYRSKAFAILEDMTNNIYERGYLLKLEFGSALKSIHENKRIVTENLRLLMRGLQEISSASGNVYLSMQQAFSSNQLEGFVDQFLKGQSLILQPLEKAASAIRRLGNIPAAMKLFFGSLSGTERAVLIEKGKDATKPFWIFFYFDPEIIYKYGYRVVLLQIFCGLHKKANEIKNRVERVLGILERGEREIKENLDSFISSFPIQTKS